MSIYSLVIKKEDFDHLIGLRVDVVLLESPGFKLDEQGLKRWCTAIADDVVCGRDTREGLIAEGVDIRITNLDNQVIVDTISRPGRGP